MLKLSWSQEMPFINPISRESSTMIVDFSTTMKDLTSVSDFIIWLNRLDIKEVHIQKEEEKEIEDFVSNSL